MAEDFDVEAMLEAPYKKNDENINHNDRLKENGISNHDSSKYSGKSRHRSRTRSKDRRSRSKDRRSRSKDKRSRSKDRRSRSKDRRSKSREKRSKSRDIKRSRSKDRRSRDRLRSKSKDRRRSRDRDRRSRSKDRRRSRDRLDRDRRRPSRERRRSRDRDRRRSRSRDRLGRRRTPSPIRAPWPPRGRSPPPRRGGGGGGGGGAPPPPEDDLSPEERDARTIFCMQLSQRIRARELEEFFSSVGKVRDVRLITCNKTRRFKGIAYIEFKDPESVPLALGLSGQKLLGIPIVVQNTQAEKNRMGNSMPNLMPKGMTGPMRLYVGSLHFNITEDMLRGIFEPFGKIDNIQLIMDTETGRSKGYGFITFHNCEDAKKALEQLNGFELAGRPMKVGNVTERLDLQQTQGPSILDSDELDRSGIDLGATGRLQLMFKLAEGAGLQVPAAAASALSMTTGQGAPVASAAAPPIATQCFMLSNMFDPVESAAADPNWHVEIRDDVIEECNKHGGVLHVYVDRASPQGNVYVKCPSIATAVASVNSLHGRWFAGRVITAAYVPLLNYHSLFPDAMTALTLLLPTRKQT